MLQALIIIGLFILDLYIIYLSPYLEEKRLLEKERKYKESIIEEQDEKSVTKFSNYPNKILISVSGIFANVSVEFVDIKDECFIDELVLTDVKQIINFNLKANKISFINSHYKEADGVVFDNENTVCFIYKPQTINKLKDLARSYNIKRSALKYFSNASYIQFSNKGMLRISHPYNEKEGKIKLVCPKKIDGIEVTGLEINYHNLNYIFINDSINQVIFEVEANISRIDLDKSKYLKLRNGKLVYRKYNLIISCFNNVRKIDKKSPKHYYKPAFTIKKNITFCRNKEE